MARTNDYSVGLIEVVYNPNGHTYWIEGVVDDNNIKFHHVTPIYGTEKWDLDDALIEAVEEFNKDYRIKLVDFSFGQKNYYLYEVIW